MPISLEIFKDARKTKDFQSGEVIFERGAAGDYMYVVLEGEVDIVYQDKIINKIQVGEVFGEMALIDDSPRSATARAAQPTKTALVNRFDFTFYVQHSPFFALDMLEIMANRLRRNMDE